MLIRRMTADEFHRIAHGAAVLARDDFGDKVLRLADGHGLKLFRNKKKFSSNWVWPYALRFRHAADQLARRGIPTVVVDDLFRVPEMHRDVVIYQFMPGRTLRDTLAEGGSVDELMEGLARFLAELHAKGVYFRAIHFGNVILLPDGRWGLIDVSETRFRPWSLWMRLRARNFKPLLRYEEDAAALTAFGHARFLERYVHHAGLSRRQAHRLADGLVQLDQRFAMPA